MKLRSAATNARRKPAGLASRWSTAARLGQAAWFFGNLYEGLVGVPQLIADARSRRAPELSRAAGLIGPGSPVRYFAPVGPVAVGATTVTLVRSWQSGGDQRLITTTAVGMASAMALTAYLIRSVNLRLLVPARPLSEHDRRSLGATFHTINALRLAALGIASASFSRLVSARSPDAESAA